MSDIFLSYASVDRQRIKPLVEALQKCGYAVWWDPTILPGQVWRQVIYEGLKAARCVVVVWSRSSISSHWVTQEADDGLKRRILVPMKLDPVPIPFGFGEVQAADLINWNGAHSTPRVRQAGARSELWCRGLDCRLLRKTCKLLSQTPMSTYRLWPIPSESLNLGVSTTS